MIVLLANFQVPQLRPLSVFQGQLSEKWFFGEEKTLELSDKNKPELIKYKLSIFDKKLTPKESKNKQTKNNYCCCFFTPLGREAEWMFNTNEGRKELSKQIPFRRIIFACAASNSLNYGNLKDVTDELSQVLGTLYPPGTPGGYSAPIMSVGAEIGEKILVEAFNDKSEESDENEKENIQIYDFRPNKDSPWTRRMVFGEKSPIIQSEVRLLTNKKSKKPNDRTPDNKSLYGEYYLGVISSILTVSQITERKPKILVLGVGGGCLISHLDEIIKGCEITGVEISKNVIELARKYFGLKVDNIIEEDALTWLANQNTVECSKYDIIILDINSFDPSDSLVCPARPFITKEIVQKYKSLLKDTESIFITNVLSRASKDFEAVMNLLKDQFEQADSLGMANGSEFNRVVTCRMEAKHKRDVSVTVEENLANLKNYEHAEDVTSSYQES